MNQLPDNTYLWVEGVSPPFPPPTATDSELLEFLRRCIPIPGILDVLPKKDWEVSDLQNVDLHIIRIPFMAHTYAQPYLQRNVVTDKLRLMITFPGYDVKYLPKFFKDITAAGGGKLYTQARHVARQSTEILRLQKKVQEAEIKLRDFIDQARYSANQDESSNGGAGSTLKNKNVWDGTIYGKIAAIGSTVQIQFPNLNQDAIVDLARHYVADKKLGWDIRKPYAWTDYGTVPHVTIKSEFITDVGKTVTVTIGKIYHFVSESRWVALDVHLPPPYACDYECHLSIGQERLPIKK
jgi:hypothetical protein